MRRILSLFTLVVLVVIAGCCQKTCDEPASCSKSPQTPAVPTAAQIHFVGAEQLSADTNAAYLNGILSLPETRAFQDQTLRKLARTPFEIFREHLAGTNDFSAEIRPLLEDIVRAETFAAVRGTNENAEYVLAIHLSEGRAQIWKTNLATVLQAWTGIQIAEIAAEGFKGWELKKHHAPDLFRFVRAGEWVVFGAGQGALPFQNELLARIKANNRPVAVGTNSWLEILADFSALNCCLGLPEPIARSKMKLNVVGKNENLRTELTLTAPEKFDLQLEPWRVPTNTIREPLISFSAGRGIRSYLSQYKFVHEYDVQPVPNQFYLWALEQIPFQTYVIAPFDSATNALERIAPRITANLSTNLFHHNVGTIQWATNHTELTWIGLPILVPFLQPVKETAGEFLFAGVFPKTPSKKTLPPDLLAQVISTTNLVYYDWEITADRIPQWRNLTQLYSLIGHKKPANLSVPGQKWLDAITSQCGNTVTKITLTKPNELTLERKSNLGFTAFELVSLVGWLDSANFPLTSHQAPLHSGAITNTAPQIH